MTRVAPGPARTMVAAPERELSRLPRKVRFEHVRALLALNALYFGVAALAAGYTYLNPAMQSQLTRSVADAFSPSGGLGTLVQAYLNGELLAALVMTFLVNLIFGSLVFLTLPSAVVPLAGILLGTYRTRWRAYRHGLAFQTRVYAAVVALLAIAAVYEAIEVIWILPAVAAA